MRRRNEIEEEEVGSRSFVVQRSRAVEEAMAHVRHGLGVRWDLFLPDELKSLEWILGEAWALMGSRAWEQVGFNQVTTDMVEAMISQAQAAEQGKVIRLTAARKVKRLLATLPPPGEAPAAPESDAPKP